MTYDHELSCPRCQVGRLHESRATYTRLYHGMLVAFPDALSYTCDVCGFQEFDTEDVSDVLALTGDGEPLPRENAAFPQSQSVEPAERGEASHPKP